ncbi:protein CPR-5-like isoform X2 [Tripterygium wilfordii]|uniref:protein CPR-5-like isoform X2 n=1 Tax=Tripterygium wilfordii TaxID=458696 RepID=UPI0018F827D1|nr:protein CPR-5-like isoform X2 [Tripterygium wilfordii]
MTFEIGSYTHSFSSMEASSSSSSVKTFKSPASISTGESPITLNNANLTVEDRPMSDRTVLDPSPSSIPVKRKKKKRNLKDVSATPASSSCNSQRGMGMRVAYKRCNQKLQLGSAQRGGGANLEEVALPLGMSFAAVVAQVLERKDAAGERMPIDHLSKVFGDQFDCFVRNFEKSFGSTLRTLRLINESSMNMGQSIKSSDADATLKKRGGCTSICGEAACHSARDLPALSIQNIMNMAEDLGENTSAVCVNQEFVLRRQENHPACVSPSILGSVVNNRLSTFEKSVMEQARFNDLKTVEIGLAMEKLKFKEAQLALHYDSNKLARSKFTMGVSKALFKAEMFKNQLEDVRHAELLRKCIDSLVAGLIIMLAALISGAYFFSYERITEVTSSCWPSPQDSKWWMPQPFASFNSGFKTFKCQVQVMSKMLFGISMIIVIVYLLVQRVAIPRQTMPVTFILLLLGVGCGCAGKLCVDSLGGSGLQWLLYWEILCSLHLLCNLCTSTVFIILHGPVTVSQGEKRNARIPYWFRRCLFYAIVIFSLPLFGGLLPFASPGEWKDRFFPLVTNHEVEPHD